MIKAFQSNFTNDLHLKKHLLLAICSLLALHLHAQSLEGHYMPYGIGYGYETVKDEALSPVSYSGSLGAMTTGYYYQNEKWLSALDLTIMGGFQSPDVNRENNPSQTISVLSRGTYELAHRIFVKNNWTFFAGIYSHNIWDYRNHNRYTNSADNYTGLFSFGPVVNLQKPFNFWNKSWAFQYNLGLPFGTYFMRPGYVRPYSNYEIGNKGFAFWGKFYTIDSRADLIWIFKNGNILRLSYHWDYEQLNDINLVQLGAHRISLTTIFKF